MASVKRYLIEIKILKVSLAGAKAQRRHTRMSKKLRYMYKIAAIFARTDNTT